MPVGGNLQMAGLAGRLGSILLLAGATIVHTPWSYAAAQDALAPASGWQFRVTPYVWLPGVSGDATVRGHTVDIDVSFWDFLDSGSSGAELDSLAALMGYVEARKGPWGIYGDVVWGKFDFSGEAVKQRNPIADLTLKAGAKAGLGYETTMAEGGLTYEVANWGATPRNNSIDLILHGPVAGLSFLW
ncbi:MAG: hypothetical protein ACREYF_12895 [Gammaproteobacteria bacterium]